MHPKIEQQLRAQAILLGHKPRKVRSGWVKCFQCKNKLFDTAAPRAIKLAVFVVCATCAEHVETGNYSHTVTDEQRKKFQEQFAALERAVEAGGL